MKPRSKLEMRSSQTTRRRKLFCACGSTVATLVLLEISLRLFWIPPSRSLGGSLSGAGIFVRSLELGWRTRPNMNQELRFCEGTSEVTIRTNSGGFRDVEHPILPHSDIPRVVVLGDSFTFGYGVRNDEIFTSHLQEILPQVEIVNLGVSAYNLAQEHKVLRTDGLAYEPSVVLLAFCQNDITKQEIPIPRPSADPASHGGFRHFVRTHSYLCDLLAIRIASSKPLTKSLGRLGIVHPLKGYDDLNDSLRPALINYPPSLVECWNSTVEELSSIQQTCQVIGARLLVATIPARESVDPESLSSTLACVAFEADQFELDKPYRELEMFCQTQGISYVNPCSAFRAARDPLYISQDIHFNARGHRLFAELVAPTLRQLLNPQTATTQVAPYGDIIE